SNPMELLCESRLIQESLNIRNSKFERSRLLPSLAGGLQRSAVPACKVCFFECTCAEVRGRCHKTKKPRILPGLSADRTGLEPATSCVTGRHSNQLNYRSNLLFPIRWVTAERECKDNFGVVFSK